MAEELKQSHESSLKRKMANNEKTTTLKTLIGIDDLGDDLMHNILGRLPALSFAWAACVSRSWNSTCNRILSAPKLASAVSFKPSLQDAVNEVVDKVLSGPIRPHFALASIGPAFDLRAALPMIDGKLGSKIPIIANVSEGIIGRDVLMDKFVEVQWEVTDEEEDFGAIPPEEKVNRGIILTVGFLPGLKVQTIPLIYHPQSPRGLLVDEFVMDIREFTSAVSDSASPAGIIVFSDQETDVRPALQIIEYAFPEDTFVLGDMGSRFLYRSNRSNNIARSSDSNRTAVALVFARDRIKPSGTGETQFNVMLSTGISPIGSTYKAVSVKTNERSTFLTASRETLREHLDGQAILEDIYDELGDRIQYPAFYVGVTKRRKCSVGTGRVRRLQFHEFHEVLGGDEEYLFVNSTGIKTGDRFRFYISDSKAAMSSSNEVSDNLKHLNDEGCDKREVFGGLIFSCCGRGETFFGHPGIDSAPFVNNFPGVTFGGTFCAGEIGRVDLSLYDKDNVEGGSVRCTHHVYSSIYLVMSYCPPSPQQ